MVIIFSIVYIVISIAVAINAKKNGFSFGWYLFFSLVSSPIVAKITLNIANEINSKVVDSPNNINIDQEQETDNFSKLKFNEKEQLYIENINNKLQNDYNKKILELVKFCYNNNFSIAESIITRIRLIRNIKKITKINKDINTIIYIYFNRYIMDNIIFNDYNKYELSSCYSDYCVIKDKENQTLLSNEINDFMEIILNGGYTSDLSRQLLNVILSNSGNDELSYNDRQTILKYLNAIPEVLKEMYKEK